MTTTVSTTDTLAAQLKAVLSVAMRKEELDLTVEALSLPDRETYLAFVAAWKARLREVEAEIRSLKAACKGPGDHSGDQYGRHLKRVEARGMMLVRKATKVIAAASRASLKQEAVAA